MFSTASLLMFIGSAILLILAPGPDIIFTLTQGITKGRKTALLTAMGLTLGNSVHTVAAALGLSIIFKTSAVAFTVFKTFGAVYLFFLAYKSIKHRKDPLVINKEDNKTNDKMILMRGFLMNVLNPKVALFYLAFLPQFVNHENGNIAIQMIVLGLIFMILTAILFSLVAFFSGFFGDWIQKRPRFSEYMNIIASTVFIGLGVKLITSRR